MYVYIYIMMHILYMRCTVLCVISVVLFIASVVLRSGRFLQIRAARSVDYSNRRYYKCNVPKGSRSGRFLQIRAARSGDYSNRRYYKCNFPKGSESLSGTHTLYY